MKVSKVRQKTIVEQVMDQIKDLIASGQLQPHDKIPTETELAQMFGIGRSSVREAIKIFQYLGILEASPRKGTFVCDYTNVSTEALTWSILLRKNDIFELVGLREVIEANAVETLTGKVAADPDGTRPIIDLLHGVIARMQRAVAASSIEEIVEADYEFHRLVIGSCDNTLFSNIYDTLRAFMQEEIRKTNLLDSARSELVPEHQAILTGIASGDGERALAAFTAHIGAIRQQLRQSLALA
jgi:GntR family transcriptional regulator, transcriptional repressor for pyruvate dehydrogenase complex